MSPNPNGQNWVWAVFGDIDFRKRSAGSRRSDGHSAGF
jgi:hypothetical protein